MIPRRYIEEWKTNAPWPDNDNVEQDLIISRALVEIFSDDFLKETLAFRGGTALHKLYLNPAPRYSEDIDLVQIKEGPIKPILQRIDKVITFFEEKRVVKPKANNNTVLYRFDPEHSPVSRRRLKIEINCREHFTVFGLQEFPFEVKNEWFSGKAAITTYDPNELLGTKLRALYQRKKGRDLFDLHYAGHNMELNYEKVVHTYQEYMWFVVNNPPTQKQFLQNLEAKETDLEFLADMEGLIRPGVEYNQAKAFEWVKEKIIKKLK